jgi:hypothetical protein
MANDLQRGLSAIVKAMHLAEAMETAKAMARDCGGSDAEVEAIAHVVARGVLRVMLVDVVQQLVLMTNPGGPDALGRFATGGVVKRDRPYIVGEGQEHFVPAYGKPFRTADLAGQLDAAPRRLLVIDGGELQPPDRIDALRRAMAGLPIVRGDPINEHLGIEAVRPEPVHPVDALEEVAARAGLETDPERMAEMRAICDQPVTVVVCNDRELTPSEGRRLASWIKQELEDEG